MSAQPPPRVAGVVSFLPYSRSSPWADGGDRVPRRGRGVDKKQGRPITKNDLDWTKLLRIWRGFVVLFRIGAAFLDRIRSERFPN